MELPPNDSVRLLWGDDLQHREEFYKAQEAIKLKKQLRNARQRLTKDPDYSKPYSGSRFANGKYAHKVNKNHPWRTPLI